MPVGSPLDELLERADEVFSLASSLGERCCAEPRPMAENGEEHPTAWGDDQDTFDVLCVEVLELRDAMLNPPKGFGLVAPLLLQMARVTKQIRDAMRPRDSQEWAKFRDYLSEMHSIGIDGERAVMAAEAAWFEDGYAFLDQLAPICGAASSNVANAGKADSTKQPRRRTGRGEGRAKLIAALTKHHQYADGSCLNQEPIGNNDLAKLAGVRPPTASDFFRKAFDGHAKYKVLCRNVSKLVASLKLLNNEFSPHHLYGSHPPGDDNRAE